MDNMLSATPAIRVSPGLPPPSDSDELPRKLNAIARIYAHLKRVIRPRSDRPGRSTRRRRVVTDMHREGNVSPSRRSPPPGNTTREASHKSSSAYTQENTSKPSCRDGAQSQDRGAKPLPVAVTPGPADLPPGGLSSHQTASRHGVSPLPSVGRYRMNSPEASAFIEARIKQRRIELIDKLMAVIYPYVDRTLNALEATCDGGGSPPAIAGTKRSREAISSSESSGGPSMGKKRWDGNQSHESDGENEGDQRNGGRTIKRTKTIAERNRKFACPYYKRDPIKHAHSRTCSGPGWDEVHRMKEHLYRRHELPRAKCHRCYEYFGQERDLEDHLRMDVPCIIRERGAVDPIQGFDEQQRNALKSNRRSKLTEVERWKEVYSILFRIPVDSPEMPSPFYEDSDVNRAAPTAEFNSKDFTACVSYCRREAPKAIRQALEAHLNHEFGMVEERMKTGLVRVVEESLVNLLTTWQSIKAPEEVSAMPDPNSSPDAQDIDDIRSAPPKPVPQPDITSLIQDFFPEDIDFEPTLSFGVFQGSSFRQDGEVDMDHQSLEADSGYQTYSEGSNCNDPTKLLATPAYGPQSYHY